MSRSWKCALPGALLLGLLGACAPAQKTETQGGVEVPRAGVMALAAVGHLDAVAAKDFLAAHPEALILDVRNPEEWDSELGHIEGARQIPLPELQRRMDEVAAWKDKPIVVVCRVGQRSQRAAEMLAHAGYRQVMNLEGGMIAWRQAEEVGK